MHAASGTFPLNISVPVGRRVRIIFANGRYYLKRAHIEFGRRHCNVQPKFAELRPYFCDAHLHRVVTVCTALEDLLTEGAVMQET